MAAINASTSRRLRGDHRVGAGRSTSAAERLSAELAGATAEEVARRLRVLGHPARLGLVVELASGPRSVAELAVGTGLDPAAASKHLRELLRASLVVRHQDGTHAIYALADVVALKVLLLMARSVKADAERIAATLRGAS